MQYLQTIESNNDNIVKLCNGDTIKISEAYISLKSNKYEAYACSTSSELREYLVQWHINNSDAENEDECCDWSTFEVFEL